MAVTTAVLTGNVTDLTGTADTTALRSARLAIESSTTDSALLDTAGNKVMVGLEQVTIDTTTGAFSKTLVRTDSADIVPATGRMYRAHLRYTSKRPDGSSEAKTLTSGWFTLTADSTLASKWTGIEAVSVPATANLNDVAMTNVDALTTSTFRVQQDARAASSSTADRARANHTGTQPLATISDAGTAAPLNVPATGDAAAGEVVKGSDTRLTNARTPSAHVHAAADVTSGVFAIARLATGTPDGTKFVRDDGTLAVPAGGGSGPLAHVTRTATADSSYSTTSTTPVDVDATNLAITFTAPASGIVIVDLRGLFTLPGGGGFWSLRNGTTNVVGTERSIGTASGNLLVCADRIRVTGLTSGSSYTYKLAYRASSLGGTVSLYYGNTTAEFSGNSRGPVTMTVWSA